MIKETTKILEANEGIHDQKAYRKMKAMLINNKFINPRLYHMVLTGSKNVKEYQAGLKELVAKLKSKKIDCKWKAAQEFDEEKEEAKGKGLHFHVFLLCESYYKATNSILNHIKKGWLCKMMGRRKLNYYFAPPQNKIHRTKAGRQLRYATLAGEKLADCLIWISYLVKNRSKQAGVSPTYFSSRTRAKKSSLKELMQ